MTAMERGCDGNGEGLWRQWRDVTAAMERCYGGSGEVLWRRLGSVVAVAQGIDAVMDGCRRW